MSAPTPTKGEQRKIDAACEALGFEARAELDSQGRNVVWFHVEGRRRAVLTLFELAMALDPARMVAHRAALFEVLEAELAEAVRIEGPKLIGELASPRLGREAEALLESRLRREYRGDALRGALLCYRIRVFFDRDTLEVTIEPR